MDRAWTVSEEMYILDTTEIRVWQEPAHCIYECILKTGLYVESPNGIFVLVYEDAKRGSN